MPKEEKVLSFVELLKELLISEEFQHTSEDADRLIKTYVGVLMGGIMSGRLRATAMALEMADNK